MNKKWTIVLISVVVLIITEVAVVYSLFVIRDKLVDNLLAQYEEQEIAVGQQVAKNLVAQITQLETDLRYFSLIEEIRKPDLTTCNDRFQTILSLANGRINNLGRVGRDKKFLCSVNKSLVGTDASKLGSYIDDIFQDPDHKPVLSQILKIPNVEGYAIALHIPIYNDQGEFDGTIGGAIYFNQIKESLLRDVTFVGGGFVALIDNDLGVLYHPKTEYISKNIQDKEVFEKTGNDNELINRIQGAVKGDTSVYRYKFDNEERVGAFVPAKVFGNRTWVVNVVIPISVAFQLIETIGVDQTFIAIYGMLSVGIILAPLIILLYLLYSVFRPLDQMKGSLKLISEGNLDTRIDHVSGNEHDEINSLAMSFNKMATKLQESYGILEKKVKERTEELEKEKISLEAKVKERTKELEGLTKNLEEKVKDRTKELDSKVEDLEKINRVMIDRELKMAELKKEIELLKSGRKEPTNSNYTVTGPEIQ